MHAAGAQIFLHAQRRSDDLEVGDVADPQRKDREVAGDAGRPQRRLRAEAGSQRLRRLAHRGVGIEQVARQPLDVGRIGERQADMARLHLRARPGQHRLAREALGMLQPRHRLLDLDARLADDRPEGHRNLLAGRHAHLPAQRNDRIEHEAGAARQLGAGLECRRIGDRAAAAEEGAAVGLGFGGALRAGAVVDEMRELDDRLVGRARAAARMDDAVVGADLGFARTSWRMPDGRCRRLPAPAPARQRTSPRCGGRRRRRSRW